MSEGRRVLEKGSRNGNEGVSEGRRVERGSRNENEGCEREQMSK